MSRVPWILGLPRVLVLSSPIPDIVSEAPRAEREKETTVGLGSFFQPVSTVNFILGISRADPWIQGAARYSRDNKLLRRSLCFGILSRDFTFVNVRCQICAWSQVKSLVVFKIGNLSTRRSWYQGRQPEVFLQHYSHWACQDVLGLQPRISKREFSGWNQRF